MSYPTVARLEIGPLVRRIASVGGPKLVPIRALGGGAVGAWEVGNEHGTSLVLTWMPPGGDERDPRSLDRAIELANLARAHGIPVPRYESVIPLPEGDVVVLQEMVRGVLPPVATPGLIESLVDLAARRVGLLADTRFAGQTTSLYLVEDGPGFCLHGPLRDHDPRTRALLARIEAIGSDARTNAMVGRDLVHFDYHLGNVIVDPDESALVLAIVDWGGARREASPSTWLFSSWTWSSVGAIRPCGTQSHGFFRTRPNQKSSPAIGPTAFFAWSTGAYAIHRRTTSNG